MKIGSGWCTGKGPWTADATGRLVKAGKHGAISRERPCLSNDGMGVHHPQLREPNICRELPSLSNNGRGVHRPLLREPGVLSDDPANEFRQDVRRWTGEVWEGPELFVLMCMGPFASSEAADLWLDGHD